jgi:GTP cyclohydrolase I
VSVNYRDLMIAAQMILKAIGSNTDDPNLEQTPRRFADLWKEFIEYDPGYIETTFNSVTVDQMVVICGIQTWSICAHHLLPFSSTVSIGYLTADKVLGLSKFARVTHKHAHKLQTQEQLVHDIANEIEALAETQNVAVYASGEHLCMTMRGVKTPAVMKTSVMRGVFLHDFNVRQEFLKILAL